MTSIEPMHRKRPNNSYLPGKSRRGAQDVLYKFEIDWFDILEFSRGQCINKCATFSVHYYIVATG